MILTRMRGDRQVAWFTHCDFAEGVAEAETFAVKLKKAAVTEEFRNVFEACVSKCKGKDSPKKESSSPAPLTEMFAAPVGSWECASCLVQNQPTAEMCVACSTARPESREDTTTIQTTSIPTTILTATATTSDSLAARFSAPVGSWECDSCLVRNQSTTDECVACGASKPGSSDKPPPAQGGTLPIKFGLPTSSMGSTSTFNFGAPGQMSDLKLDNLSFGTPVSKGTSSGGFKMGGLTLGALGTELAGEESASTSEPLSLFGAGSHSLFGGHSSAADSDGKSLFGATTESSQGKTEQKISFKLGDTSTGTQPASESGLFGMQAETEGTDSGFKFSLPSLTAAASGGKGRGKLDQGEEGILKLEPFGLKETKPEAKPFSGFGSNEDKPGSDVASIFKSSLPATLDSGGVKLFQFSVPSPQSSPVPPSPEQQNTSHSSAHEPDIHFEPIVTLPDSVEVSSGEENEEALFTDRSKLFRFDSKLNQWKERGVGEIKVLVNRDAGKARVLMRRDQVLKICCNHLITRDMSLTPMQNSQKAWTWLTLCDFADETGKPEKLAVRFKSPAIADAFKKAFEDAQECGGRETPTGDSAQKTAVPHGELANGEHDEHNGEDHEDGEGEEDGSTPAITSHEVADLKPDDSHEGATPPQKSQLSLAFPTTSQIRFGARLKITPHLSSVVTRQESSPETNDEHQSSPSRTPSPVEERPTQLQAESLTAQSYNEDDQDDVIFISVDLPSEDKIKLAEEYMLPPSFFNYETQPPCPGCRGCVDLLTGPCEPSSLEPKTDEQGSAKEEDVGVEKEDSKSGFKHFSGSHGESSFSSLAASTGGSEDVLWGKKSSGFSGFRGAGTQLFAAKPPSLEEDENPEAEANMNFKPIVMLTAVETKTGEEEEECLFSHRAKLYRFNDGQWKERGVGDIKILRNRVTERSRVVMRRDQILKICCNHLITPEMSLQKNISSEKTRTWKTLSDFAEETAKEEIFSVRFKHVEMAKTFEEVFKACQAVSDQSITGDSKSPSGPVTPPHPPHQEEQLQGDDAHSTVPDKARMTCMSLKEVMLTSAASSETEEETGIDGELPRPQEPASSPVDKAPEKKSADTTPRLRLPLTPPPPVGSGSVLSSAGSALRLPLTEPQEMMGGNSESPLPEEAGNNAKTEESETEQPQEPHTQAPLLFGSSASVSFADLAKDESEVMGGESESPLPEEAGNNAKTEESETEQPQEPQTQAPPLFGSSASLTFTKDESEVMGGESESPLPEEAGNNVKAEESETTEKPQEPQTQAPPLFGSSASVSFADLAKDESEVMDGESESPLPEEGGSTHVKAEESETTEQPLEPQAQAPPLFDSSASVSSDLAKEVMGGEPIPEEERSTHEAEESETTEKPLEPQAQAPPLFDSSTSLSFANLAKDGSVSGFLGFQKTEGFQFGGVGGKIFSSGAAEDQEHPEKEIDIHFKPVVTLPETVNIKSWDDDADTLFCRRCKLYRFTDERQWKDRGVGELKIMKHRVTGKVKLIMRRDQIFKLCCNHSLTSDMKLTVMAHSEKACSWFTSADLSEEEARPEKLSAKFKSAKFMNEFREAFERCQTELVASDEVHVDENRESEGKVGESVSMQSSEGRKEEQEGERNSDGKAEHQTDDI